MNPYRASIEEQLGLPTAPGDVPGTVQLLVVDAGSRRTIRRMLEEYFAVRTDDSVVEADLYLIEDTLLAQYRSTLLDRMNDAHPAFCPVVVIQGNNRRYHNPLQQSASETPISLVDDFVEAPVDREFLIRRLYSLLVRRNQSVALLERMKEKEERERELRQFQRTVESSGNGVLILDTEGVIKSANPAIATITGYQREEIEGRTSQFLQPTDAESVFTIDFWKTITDTQGWEGELVLDHKGGQRSVGNVMVTGIRDDSGGLEGYVMVINDITERIQREEELAQSEADLDLLRQILTRYLRHNLRNDLNVIQGYGQMLANAEELEVDHTAWATKIVQVSNQLLETSDTARNFSSLIEQEFESTALDLSSVVSSVVDEISEANPSVTFEVDIPDYCKIVAREGIDDAIRALVENAVIHNTAESPTVRVDITPGNKVRLEIEDNGPGIPLSEIATLDLGEESPLSHSEGIGLWFTKWFIESINGEISFDISEQGTCVMLTFSEFGDVRPTSYDIPTFKERQHRLQTVLQRMTDAVIEVNADWSISFVDSRAEEILGITAETVLGVNFWEQFPGARDTPFSETYQEAMETRSTKQIIEYYAPIKMWLEVVAYPEFGGGLSFYFRDVTEQKTREEQLRAADERIDIALTATGSTVWEWDFQNDAIQTHPEIHIGHDRKITTFEEFLEGIYPADRPHVEKALRSAIDTNTPYHVEYRVLSGDSIEWIDDYGEIQREDGIPIKMIGIARNITEQKERHRRYEAIFNQTYQFTGLMEPDGTLIEVNDTALEFGGLTRDEVIGEKIWKSGWFTISEATQVQTKADVTRAAEGEFVRRVLEVSGQDGTASIDFTIRPIIDKDGDVQLLIPEGRDISERIERERELERSQELLSQTSRIANVGGWEINPDTMDIFRTKNLFEILGVDEGYAPSVEDALEHFHEDDQALLYDVVEAAIESAEAFDVEARAVPPGREMLHLRIRGTPVLEDGEVVAIRGATQDISDRKTLEKALQSERDLFTTIVETSPVGITVVDADGTLAFVNERAEEIYGQEREEITDFSHDDPRWDLVTEEGASFEPGQTPFERVVNGSQQRDQIVGLRRPSGERVWVSVNGEPILSEDGTLEKAVFAFHDITEQRERQWELKERVKELTAVHLATNVFASTETQIEELLAEYVQMVPHSFQYPSLAEARFRYQGNSISTSQFSTSDFSIVSEVALSDGSTFSLEVVYLENPQDEDQSIFLNEEHNLITTLVSIIAGHIETRRYIKELRRSRTLLKHTEKLAQTGGWEADAHTGRQRWTAGTYHIHGLTEASDFDPTVDSGIDYYHPDDQEEIRHLVETCMEEGTPYQTELRLITEAGEQRWVRTNGEAIRDGDDIVTVRGAIQDIAEQKAQKTELQRERDRLATLFEQLPTPAVHLTFENGEPLINRANAAFESVFGVEHADIIGENLNGLLIPPDEQDERVPIHNQLMETGTLDIVAERKTVDGVRTFILNAAAHELTDGTTEGYVIYSDITDVAAR